jgi:hypothetical protein
MTFAELYPDEPPRHGGKLLPRCACGLLLPCDHTNDAIRSSGGALGAEFIDDWDANNGRDSGPRSRRKAP